jgi:hypothetical protein
MPLPGVSPLSHFGEQVVTLQVLLFGDYRHLIFTLGDAPPLFIADLPAQQFADLGFGQHVSEFDISGNFIGCQTFAAPFNQVRPGHPVHPP